MPGGQYTNLSSAGRARWAWAPAGPKCPQAYADVNQLFGDIVKVTPTSKVVGDMALFMVANNLTPADVDGGEIDLILVAVPGELGYRHVSRLEDLRK